MNWYEQMIEETRNMSEDEMVDSLIALSDKRNTSVAAMRKFEVLKKHIITDWAERIG